MLCRPARASILHINENRNADTSTNLFCKAVVSKGQRLYLPKGWWHEVPSLS